MDEQAFNLNITDIGDAVKVIDYACEQGAFKGWANIRQILALRERLHTFVTAAAGETQVNTPARSVLSEGGPAGF